jgi:integrase
MTKIRYTTSDFFTTEELSRSIKFFNKKGQYKMALLFEFGPKTMLRYSDLAKLKWEDLINKESLILKETKTKKRREITLGKTLANTIVETYNKLEKPQKSDIVFNYSIQYVNRLLKKVAIELKIKKRASTHLFRKSGARYVWQSNDYSDQYLIKLSEILNHSSTEITRRYLGITREEIKDIYNGFDDML